MGGLSYGQIEKKAGEQSPPAESITDDQLLSFVPVITADEIQVEEEIPEEIQGKLTDLDE